MEVRERRRHQNSRRMKMAAKRVTGLSVIFPCWIFLWAGGNAILWTWRSSFLKWERHPRRPLRNKRSLKLGSCCEAYCADELLRVATLAQDTHTGGGQ